MPHPESMLLLGDLDGFLGIVFFLIAFVGWVINLVSQHQEQAKKTQRRSGGGSSDAKRRAQAEMQAFLNQSREPENQTRGQVVDDVEIISEPPRRRRPPRRRTQREIWEEQTGQSQPPPRQEAKRPAPPKPKSRPGQDLASRHLESSSEKKKKKEKDKKKESRSALAQKVEKDLPHAVDQHVSSHLEAFSASAPTSTGNVGMESTTANRPAKSPIIRKMLHSKADARNAILLSEVLAPPLALRKRSD